LCWRLICQRRRNSAAACRTKSFRERYDDGGYSGGSLDRPALTQLIKDIKDGLVDVVVVYKIDRLCVLITLLPRPESAASGGYGQHR